MKMPPPWLRQHAWTATRLHKRRSLLRRAIFMLLPLTLFFVLLLAGGLALSFGSFSQNGPRPEMIALIICGIPAAFILSALIVGGLMLRRFGAPLIDVMSAADTVAEGDFSIRVRENAPGEFGQLARSFNRMTAELELAETRRRNLTADVAHELRSPLQIIQGNLEGILDGLYPPDREHLSATLDETRLLARLVSDLQTLSLAESDQLPLHFVTFSAADLLEDIRVSFEGLAAAAGVELRLYASAEDPGLQMLADPERLDQVLSNLMTNALRHTPSGGQITLRASSSAGMVIFEVQDSGPGIPPADLPYIFDRFYRGDPARTRGSGTGLGLAIARQLVQAHAGQIEVSNLPEGGALFRVEVPNAPYH